MDIFMHTLCKYQYKNAQTSPSCVTNPSIYKTNCEGRNILFACEICREYFHVGTLHQGFYSGIIQGQTKILFFWKYFEIKI